MTYAPMRSEPASLGGTCLALSSAFSLAKLGSVPTASIQDTSFPVPHAANPGLLRRRANTGSDFPPPAVTLPKADA